MDLSKEFWNTRYWDGDTGWDIGDVSTPLKEYFDTLQDKTISILIPGAGNAYEAEYLFKNGFKNVFVADFSPKACQQFAERVPDFPKEQILCIDFFEIQKQFDLIVEQTFFCALDPKLRANYASKMYDLLKENGALVGLLFDAPMNADQPPFGGCKEDYLALFEEKFNVVKMEKCYNSIKPRADRELFIKLTKKA